MKQWFSTLNSRERRILISGFIVLLIMLTYLLIWEPLVSESASLRTSVEAQQKTYAWMQQAAQEVRKLSVHSGNAKKPAGSLLGTINSTAKPALNGAILKRVEEDRQQGVRVWIEQVAFDELVLWLGQLQEKHGIRVSSLVSERHGKDGRVNARLILQAG